MGRKNNRKPVRIPRLRQAEFIKPHRMEIWYAHLPMYKGSVQGGARPVIIVSNDACNEASKIVTVVPLTSQIKRLNLPTHILIHLGDSDSVALAEQIITIDQRLLDRRIGKCDREAEIEAAIMTQLGF